MASVCEETVQKSIFSSVITSTACNDRRRKLRFAVSIHRRIIYMNEGKEENKTEDEEERKTESEGRKIS